MRSPVLPAGPALRAALMTLLPGVLRYPPSAEQVTAWADALTRGLRVIDRSRLVAALDRVAADRTTRNDRGDILPADVLVAYGRIGAADAGEPTWPEYCDRACSRGLCTLTDPEGYQVVVPCDCAQGEHRQRTLLICRRDSGHEGAPVRTMSSPPSPHVGDRLRDGWRLLLHEEGSVSADQAIWANEQLAAGRKVRDVLAQLRRVREERGDGALME